MHPITLLAFLNELEELEKLGGTPKGLRALANNWNSKSLYALDRAAASTAGHDAAKLLKNKAHLAIEPDAARHTIGYGKAARESSQRRLHHTKKASAFAHGAELAGLGLLAAPSVAHMRGKEWSEKNKARAEVAGLGVLAAPSALAVGKAGLAKLKGAISKMPKHAAYSIKEAVSAGYGVGVGAHKAIYGHRKPKKREAASFVEKVSADKDVYYHTAAHPKAQRYSKASYNVKDDTSTFESTIRSPKSSKNPRGGDSAVSHVNHTTGKVTNNPAASWEYAHERAKNVSKIRLKNKGAALAGAVALGASAYGAKKVYDHFKKKKEAAKEDDGSVEVRMGGFRRPYAARGVAMGAFPGLIASQVHPAGLLAAAGGGLAGGVIGHRMGKKKDIETSKKLRRMNIDPSMYGIKEAAPSMSAMMNMHRLADAAKAAKNVAKPMAQAATKLPSAAQNATRATQLAGHTAQGGHAWNAAAQAKRAIPL